MRRIRALPIPGSILFVCHGNIYRSPYAASYFRMLVPEPFRSRIDIGSAGFVEPGRACPVAAIEVAAARGVDLTTHRSSLVTADRVEGADLIVVMDPRHAVALRNRLRLKLDRILAIGDLDPDFTAPRAITDPNGQAAAVLDESFDRIARCTTILADLLIRTRLREGSSEQSAGGPAPHLG